MTTKRKWTAQEKLTIVLDGLKDCPIKEICREYGIRKPNITDGVMSPY